MWNPFWEVDYPLNDQDLEMSLKLTTMWTNFAKTGDPSTEDFHWQGQDQENSGLEGDMVEGGDQENDYLEDNVV